MRGGLESAIRINVLGNFFPPAVALLTAPVLARELGVESRGDLAAATSFFLMVSFSGGLGLPEALTRYLGMQALPPKLLKAVLSVVCVVGIAWGIGLAFAASFWVQAPLQLLYLIVAASLPLGVALTGLRGVAAGLAAWKLISLERVSGSLVRLVAIVILAALDQLSAVAAIIVIIGSYAIGAVAYLPLCRSPLGSVAEASSLRGVLSYGLRIWSGAVAGALLSRFDQAIMIPLSSSTQLGLYVVAVSIADAALVVNASLRDVVFSNQAAQPDVEGLCSLVRVSTVITALVSGMLGLVAWFAVPWLFGPEFSGVLPLLAVLLVGLTIANPGSIVGAGLAAWGMPELRSYSLWLGAVLNVGAVLLLVPSFGAMGAALAMGLGGLAAGGLNVFFISKRFQVRISAFCKFSIADAKRLRAIVGL